MVVATVLTGATIVIQNTTKKNDSLNSKIIELQDTSKRLEQQRIQEKEKLNTQNQQYQQDIDKLKKDLQAKQEQKAAEQRNVVARVVAPVAQAAPVHTGSHEDWLMAAGIPQSQWGCANALITKESGWRVNATNRSSGAYGIPQSLPGGKMASAGADWQTNPVTQLRWMLGYVNARYGSFCGAWNHSVAVNWY